MAADSSDRPRARGAPAVQPRAAARGEDHRPPTPCAPGPAGTPQRAAGSRHRSSSLTCEPVRHRSTASMPARRRPRAALEVLDGAQHQVSVRQWRSWPQQLENPGSGTELGQARREVGHHGRLEEERWGPEPVLAVPPHDPGERQRRRDHVLDRGRVHPGHPRRTSGGRADRPSSSASVEGARCPGSDDLELRHQPVVLVVEHVAVDHEDAGVVGELRHHPDPLAGVEPPGVLEPALPRRWAPCRRVGRCATAPRAGARSGSLRVVAQLPQLRRALVAPCARRAWGRTPCRRSSRRAGHVLRSARPSRPRPRSGAQRGHGPQVVGHRAASSPALRTRNCMISADRRAGPCGAVVARDALEDDVLAELAAEVHDDVGALGRPEQDVLAHDALRGSRPLPVPTCTNGRPSESVKS